MADSNSNGYGYGMAASSVFGAFSSVYGGIMQSKALREQGEYQKQMAGFNARLAEMQAADAIARGEDQVTNMKKQTKQLVGEQRATLAAQGIEINSGSALDVQNDAREQAAVDAMTIRNNASREAWGYKVQAINSTNQGNYAEMAGRQNANAAILTGNLNGGKHAMEGIANWSKYSSSQKEEVYQANSSNSYAGMRNASNDPGNR